MLCACCRNREKTGGSTISYLVRISYSSTFTVFRTRCYCLDRTPGVFRISCFTLRFWYFLIGIACCTGAPLEYMPVCNGPSTQGTPAAAAAATAAAAVAFVGVFCRKMKICVRIFVCCCSRYVWWSASRRVSRLVLSTAAATGMLCREAESCRHFVLVPNIA